MIEIEEIDIEIPVYDINVESNHNFYANDILVHNCQESYSNFKPSTVLEHTVEEENGEYKIIRETHAGVVHTCLVGETKINVSINSIVSEESIMDVISQINDGATIYVKSYNHTTKEDEFELIEAGKLMKVDSPLMRITAEDGVVIECTEDHRIWTENRGYVEAQHLLKTDILKLV